MLNLVAVADVPTSFLKDHPEAAAWALSFLAALLLIVLGVTIGLAKWAGGKFEKIAERLATLASYGVAVQELSDRVSIVERDHIATTKMAEAITGMHDAFNEMKVENVQAHSDIIQGRIGILQEVSALKVRVDSIDEKVENVKARMPNGELRSMLEQQKKAIEEQQHTNNVLMVLAEALKKPTKAR